MYMYNISSVENVSDKLILFIVFRTGFIQSLGGVEGGYDKMVVTHLRIDLIYNFISTTAFLQLHLCARRELMKRSRKTK